MELKDRIAMTVTGQLTWADPSKKANCSSCRHITRATFGKKTGTHVCSLVKAHTGKNGVPFLPDRAVACSKYER